METKTIYYKLIKAQKAFDTALKDNNNPFFKSKYADFKSVYNACSKALADNDLFVSQQGIYVDGSYVIETKVYDINGEFISGLTPVLLKEPNNPQALGSAITYARRYGLSAILTLVTEEEDDDGNKAKGKNISDVSNKNLEQSLIEYIKKIENVDKYNVLLKEFETNKKYKQFVDNVAIQEHLDLLKEKLNIK